MFPSFISKDNDTKKKVIQASPDKNKENSQNKTNQLNMKDEESKESSPETQENEKKKNWSFGQWFKKPKGGDSSQNTTGSSFISIDKNISKNITKKFEKFGNMSKNFIKEIANNVQAQFTEPVAFGDPLWGDFSTSPRKEEQKTGGKPNKKAEEDDSSEEDFDEEEDEEDENEDGTGENEEDEDDDEEEDEEDGYEEDEGTPEDDQEEGHPVEKKEVIKEEDHFAIDNNFAIDDDESPPIQHSNPDSMEDVNKGIKPQEIIQEKFTKKKGKGKGKGKGKKKKRRQPKQQEGIVLEDAFVNKRYTFGSPFTEFHQFYFKGDYLDYEPGEFFKVDIINQKGGLTNFLFHEKKYVTIQDQIFYLTKLEKVETYDLALVLESYPLSRIIRFDKIDKKKRIDISFYTEDNSPNAQREMLLEVSNYAKFVKVINSCLSVTNSSYNILRFNIE